MSALNLFFGPGVVIDLYHISFFTILVGTQWGPAVGYLFVADATVCV